MSESLTLTWGHMRKRRHDVTQAAVTAPAWLVATGVSALAFAVYLVALAPDLYSLDSPELTTAAYKLGIAHAPGYPLYTLAGWAFSHAFPIGSVAFRMNLLSAIFAAAAVGVTFLFASRLTPRMAVAAAGALVLAFSYYFFGQALAAEVYTLDALLFVGLLYTAFSWRERRTPALALTVGLLLGLGLATRTTTALYIPAIALFAWMSGERSPRAYAAAATGVLAGLAFYLYLPLRSAAGAYGPGDYALDGTLIPTDLTTWGGFWAHVTAANFQSAAFAYGPVEALREAGTFVWALTGAFLLVGLPLGIAGIVQAWKRDRGLLVLLLGTSAPLALFFINYGALDKEFMFLPAYVAWALLLVLGIDWALDRLAAGSPAWERSALLRNAVLVLPLAALIIHLPLVSLRGERSVRAEGEAFLAQLEPNAIVYGPFMDIAPLQYLQQVEGQRPDVKLVNAWTVDRWFLRPLTEANIGTTPVYVTDREQELRGDYVLVPAGSGYRVVATR